jgi:hypothetical protein
MIGICTCAGDGRGQDAAPNVPRPAVPAAKPSDTDWQKKLDVAVRELQGLNQAQTKAEGPQDIDALRKQIDLQQKQIEALLKMTQLLADQVKKQAPAGTAVENLETRVATQEARGQQAAQRDRELARAYDDLVERQDADRQNPQLPATLRELFLPTRNNESALAIYGSVAQDFRIFSQAPSSFMSNTLMLRPYMLLNEQWLMSANVALQQGTVQLYRAQLERFINDNWTVVFGRFYSPIGFFSERLRLNWVIKTPDPPLLFNQVYPQQLSFDGIQIRGARALADWPMKLEYNGFVANGLSVTGGNLPIIYSNLNNFTDTTMDINNAKAFGGRVGLSFPTIGAIVGLSGLANGSYNLSHNQLNMWDIDASWHRGNWDVRFEMVHTDQQTPPPNPTTLAIPIHRQGLYAQVAYRQYDSHHVFWQKLEWVFRFDHVQFNGINLAQTGINFGGLGQALNRQPLDRNRYTFGVNYWFYPSLALKLAYEIYDELGVPSLRDNGFVSQVVWGW